MTEREQALEAALRAFLVLSWVPDSAPGPSHYIVYPVPMARAAMAQAAILLDGKSCFPADINGSVMVYENQTNGSSLYSVWLDGMAYGEDSADVPEQHKELFRQALAEAKAKAQTRG